MKYPTLTDTGASREFSDVFGGLNVEGHTAASGWAGSSRKRVSEWKWTHNATADKYPAAATRARRRLNLCTPSPRGFAIVTDTENRSRTFTVAPDGGFCYIYVDGEKIPSQYKFAEQTYEKHIVTLGNETFVLRSSSSDTDKAVKTDRTTVSELDARFSPANAENSNAPDYTKIHYVPCDIDGDEMQVWWDNRPLTPSHQEVQDGKVYWVDTSGDDPQLKKYSSILDDWIPVSQNYTKIEYVTTDASDTPFDGFKEGDAVVIKNAAAGSNAGSAGSKRRAYNDRVIDALNTDVTASCIIKGVGETSSSGTYTSYVIVETQDVPVPSYSMLINNYIGQDGSKAFEMTRVVPVFEHVCAGENRIWGCTSSNNEIRACKLGDPSNWNTYAGISTDSYAVTVGGEPGAFTGAAFAGSSAIFFKENAVLRIYGTAPSNYRLYSLTAPGVAAGSAKSVAVVNDYVFYLSPQGVCYYDGSAVHEIGAALGGKYKNGVGAGADNKYYLSCEDESGARHLFVFDLARGMWLREDGIKALYGAAVGSSVCFIEQTGATAADCRIISSRTDAPINDTSTAGHTEEGAFDYEFVTPVIGYEAAGNKYLSRFNVRVKLENGARLDVYVRYDDETAWEHKSSVTAYGTKSFTTPIRPRRCDHMQIKFAGHGDCVIYSFAKIYEKGSDVVR